MPAFRMLISVPALALGAALRLLPAAPPTTATLSGHLAHAPAGDSVRLEYRGHYYHQRVRTVLNPAGDFKLTLPDLKESMPVTFTYGGQRTSLYLSPGDDVQLTLDFPQFDETLKYTGRGANANNYLAQSLWKFSFGPADAALPLPQTTAATTPAQIRQQADAFRQAQRNFLTSYTKTHPLPAEFQRNTLLDIDLNWAITLLEYAPIYRRLAKQEPTLPATYFNFLQELPLKQFDPYLKDRGAAGNTAVLRFLNGYGNRLLPGGKLSTDPAEAPRLYAQARTDFGLSPKTIDLAMYQLYSWKLDDNLAGVLAAYPTFRAQARDSINARNLRQAISGILSVKEGMPAPTFTLLSNEGKPVSLSDLKGKVVYLDFWGTWCGPCMREMPASNDLKKKFEGRDVAFLYISVNDNAEKWQQVLATQRLTSPNSIHLRSPDGDNVPSRYQVTQYPTYWLIGRNGRIVTRSAPHPSEAEAAAAAITAELAR
jgi:thiol-disulfide isomerase/thioredoxin